MGTHLDRMEPPSSSNSVCTASMQLDRLIRGLQSSDAVFQQNALAALCVVAQQSQEYRRIICTAPSVPASLARQITSAEENILHNAALLVGYCCHEHAAFRQQFARTNGSLRALVALLDHIADVGLVCNATWALRQIAMDPSCTLDAGARQGIAEALPRLLAHTDPRIQLNALPLHFAMQHVMQRDQHKPPSIAFRRDKSLQAVCALTRLATPTGGEQEDCESPPEVSPIGDGTHPSASLRIRSPSKRPSLLAPWKRKCEKLAPKEAGRVRKTYKLDSTAGALPTGVPDDTTSRSTFLDVPVVSLLKEA